MEKCKLYPREIKTYSELLVEASKLLNSIGDATTFAPRCLYTAFKPKNLLIFEDMKEKGYSTFPRNYQLNFIQALPVIQKLAKLHAVSAVLAETHPKLVDIYQDGSISTNPDRQDFLVHYENCARALGTVIESEWTKEWKGVGTKIKELSKTIRQKGCILYERRENAFNVLCHNDLWSPNLLFKLNDDQSVHDVLFIDFQLSYFGSPGIDLNFFIYGSLLPSTILADKNKLIRVYHEVLSETLRRLKYPKTIPSLHDLQVEILRTAFNGFISTLR